MSKLADAFETANHIGDPAQIARALLFLQQLQLLSDALRQYSIPHAFYKGPVIAEQLYGSFTARYYGDIDLFIKARDLRRARALVERFGYYSIRALPRHEERWEEWTQDAVELKHRESGVPLDLHWEIEQRFLSGPRALESLWHSLNYIEIDSKRIPTFSNEALFLVLVAHGSKHYWAEERWIADIRRLLSTTELNWSSLIVSARKLGLLRRVGVALRIAEREQSLPTPFWEKIIAQRAVSQLTEKILRVLAGESLTTYQAFLIDLKFRERLTDRFGLLLGRVFVPFGEDFDRLKLPWLLSPLHFIMKPLKVVGRTMLRR